MMDTKIIKKDFPIFANNKDVVYLDNSATSQKPQVVIDAVSDFYSKHNANIHRGLYPLSERSTDMYEEARKKVANFISARMPEEVIFTSGATSGLNMVAFGWGLQNVKKGDVILISEAEHHSNLVPWQQVAKAKEAILEYIELDNNGMIRMDDLKKKINQNVSVISIAHASNVLGTLFPVKRICEMSKEVGAKVVVDGAAIAGHAPINVESFGCDFYIFSGHKMLGPTGTGVLWGKKELLENMLPIRFGGGMIKEVNLCDASWAESPAKFEAGTPNIAGVVGLGAAVDYLNSLGMENVRAHDLDLTIYTLKSLSEIKGVDVLGPVSAQEKIGVVSFVVEGAHAHDVASVLAQQNICVRAGHHCAQPLHTKFNIAATTRASFCIYNTHEDIDKLVAGIKYAQKILT